MVRKARKLTAKPIAGVPMVPDSGELADFPDALRFINSLSQTRDGIEWDLRVYKIEGAGRGVKESRPFLFTVELEDLPNLETQLAEMYPAGGTFWVQVRMDGELKKNITLQIAPRPGWRPEPPAYLRPVPATPPENPANHMELFFGRLAEMQERSAQQTRDLIAALTQQPKQPTIMEQLAMFQEMQKIMPKGAQENGLELFQKGMDFASKLFESRGGEGGGANWMDVIKEALHSPMIQNAIAGMAAAAQQQATPPAQLGPPAHISPANPLAVQAIETLCGQASAGVDPKFVASQIGSKVPEAFIQELEEQENVVGYLIHQFPRVAQHKAWFAALVAEMFEEENTPGATLTPAAANAPNAGT